MKMFGERAARLSGAGTAQVHKSCESITSQKLESKFAIQVLRHLRGPLSRAAATSGKVPLTSIKPWQRFGVCGCRGRNCVTRGGGPERETCLRVATSAGGGVARRFIVFKVLMSSRSRVFYSFLLKRHCKVICQEIGLHVAEVIGVVTVSSSQSHD